ncbi:DUF1097 domain-containing protein [Pseudomonas sp. 2FG]|uniref:DUF1097 domain-containing protein n=1 Tax=Pseudomonas sp. 2FG TaxID=2502191 RepID=UPI001C498840|nr:DUF1097 domain-containing protein [Pseudomonas sp. 2FG]
MRNPVTLDTFKAILGLSVVASLAATISALLIEVPVWATFIGWIAFFTRGITARDGAINLTCVLIGLVIGIAAAFASAALTPYLGALTITLVVLLATFLLLSLGLLPVINNLTGFFLGLVCYFASHLPPTLDTFVELAMASALGVLGGLVASLVQKRLSGPEGPAGDVSITHP